MIVTHLLINVLLALTIIKIQLGNHNKRKKAATTAAKSHYRKAASTSGQATIGYHRAMVALYARQTTRHLSAAWCRRASASSNEAQKYHCSMGSSSGIHNDLYFIYFTSYLR